jgi:hypothetical protein
MATGPEIRRVYESAKAIFLETSQMLSEIKGELANNSLRQKNSAMLLGGSAALDRPRLWLPYNQQIVFSRRENNHWEDRAVAVNILFDDAYYGEVDLKFPIALCGILKGVAGQKPVGSDNFSDFGCKPELWSRAKYDAPFFSLEFAKNTDSAEATGYFLPLVSLEDRGKLVSLVVSPCLKLLNEDVQGSRSIIAGAAILPRDFLADRSS